MEFQQLVKWVCWMRICEIEIELWRISMIYCTPWLKPRPQSEDSPVLEPRANWLSWRALLSNTRPDSGTFRKPSPTRAIDMLWMWCDYAGASSSNRNHLELGKWYLISGLKSVPAKGNDSSYSPSSSLPEVIFSPPWSLDTVWLRSSLDGYVRRLWPVSPLLDSLASRCPSSPCTRSTFSM